MSSSDLFPQDLASCADGGSSGNLVRATKNGDSKETGIDSHVSSRCGSTHRACTGFSQMDSQGRQGEVDIGPITNPETISSDNCLQKKNQFSHREFLSQGA